MIPEFRAIFVKILRALSDQKLVMDSTSSTDTVEVGAQAPKGPLEKLKAHKLQFGVVFGVIAIIAGVSGLTLAAKSSKLTQLWQVYGHALISVQEKIDALRKADEENEKLRQENAHLRLVLESEHYEKYAEKAQKETQTFQWKLSKDTGSRTGRTLASIGYKIPQDLLPAQLYSLGLSYFKMREDEKAAVIFTFLTGLESDNTFKTPANHLLAGISWYRVENFELADFYLDQVLHSAETSATRRFHSQARLWKGLISEKTGKHVKAQYWLRDVLDHNPHSLEARWINRSGEEAEETVTREPASQEEHHGEAHEGNHH